MAENSSIEWTTHTASPWHGCSKTENPGCDNCYAAAMSVRNPETLGIWGDDGTRVKSKSFAKNLRAWQKQAERAGRSVTVFPSICDPFEDRPELVPWRQEMFTLVDECPNVIMLLLTKRPENVRRMWPANRSPVVFTDSRFRHNVWIGTSVSDQETANKAIPELLKCRDLCPVLFLSCEPLLGPIDLRGACSECGRWITGKDTEWGHPCAGEPGVVCESYRSLGVDWVIVGGESGPGHRPMQVEWVQSIVDQCRAAGAPCFVKQDSAARPGMQGRLPDDLWSLKEFPLAADAAGA